jgi:hypothetical protein
MLRRIPRNYALLDKNNFFTLYNALHFTLGYIKALILKTCFLINKNFVFKTQETSVAGMCDCLSSQYYNQANNSCSKFYFNIF